MAVDTSGLKHNVLIAKDTIINVKRNHQLLILASKIPWEAFGELAIVDLYKNKKTTGRKLNLRLHLGAFLLQALYKWQDRELEEQIRYYAPARLFCGLHDFEGLDHTQFMRFRNRITEQTAKIFSQSILQIASDMSFIKNNTMDFDSTVQEANIQYPSDALLMNKLVRKSKKILKFLSDKGITCASRVTELLDFKNLGKKFKGYFFRQREKVQEETDSKLSSKELTKEEKAKEKSEKKKEERKTFFKFLYERTVEVIDKTASCIENWKGKLPWNLQLDLVHLTKVGPKLLEQINFFIKNQKVSPDKIMSLTVNKVKCIKRGKLGKMFEFGRKWFIWRTDGNYVMGYASEDPNLDDTKSLDQALNEYKDVFKKSPDSITGDQGFWSDDNLKACEKHKIAEVGINPRGKKEWKVDQDQIESLKNRRAGVEPIIGHLKQRGLRKSKMKSDQSTFLAGQRSMLSLNLSRFIKDLVKEPIF